MVALRFIAKVGRACGSTVTALALVLFSALCKAEMVNLGPFAPSIILYGVPFDPLLTIMLEVATRQSEATLRSDAHASLNASAFSNNAKLVISKVLPYTIKGERCDFRVDRLDALDFRVTDYTGDLRATGFVTPIGCPLWPGSVSIALRVVPAVTEKTLMPKIAQVKVEVPGEWRFVSFLAGKKLDNLVADAVTKGAAKFSFAAPAIEDGQINFLGASLNQVRDNLIVRLRVEVQVSARDLNSYVSKRALIKGLSFTYPDTDKPSANQ